MTLLADRSELDVECGVKVLNNLLCTLPQSSIHNRRMRTVRYSRGETGSTINKIETAQMSYKAVQNTAVSSTRERETRAGSSQASARDPRKKGARERTQDSARSESHHAQPWRGRGGRRPGGRGEITARKRSKVRNRAKIDRTFGGEVAKIYRPIFWQ